MTNKITKVNGIFYLGTIKANAFQLQGLIFIRAFGCQGEIEILPIYTNFATMEYSHVHNLIKRRLFVNFNLCIFDEDNTK